MSTKQTFAEKTTSFVKNKGKEYYYDPAELGDPLDMELHVPEYDLAHYRELGRDYTYDPRINRKCPTLRKRCSSCQHILPFHPQRPYAYNACSNCANIPSITPDDFKVERLDPVDLDNPCQSFCTYPKDTFAYEMPPNACFRSCGNYPTWNSYFPGHFSKKWRIDPVTGDITYLPIDRGLCRNQFQTDRYPAWKYSNPSPYNAPILNLTTAAPVPKAAEAIINAQTVQASQGGRRDVSQSSAAVSQAISVPDVPIPPEIVSDLNCAQVLSNIVPGEQDLRAHRFVTDNRYNAERIKPNIFIKPSENLQVEPYNPSLYQTPYDQTKNVISTGKLVNSYLGETFETFENQMPPPNCYKPLMKKQLQHINPRLLHLSGGYNHWNPPPRKTEQCGSVFNPVSIRGGASPFGSNLYDPLVTKQLKLYTSRDIYNNKNGDLCVEPSMYGDKPQGYFGLVPRVRYQPFLPATQELELKGRTNVPEDLNPDTRKREQYTGEFFARKANLLVSRAVAPNTLLNGVEAVAQIPIASDQVGRYGQCQAYITPAFVDGASYVHHDETRPGRITEGVTTRINNPTHSSAQPSLQPIDLSIKAKLDPEQSVRIAGNPQLANAGAVLTTEADVRDTQKLGMVDQPHRTTDASAQGTGGVLTTQANVRTTQKVGVVDQALPVGDPSLQHTGGVLTSQANVRPTLKTGLVDLPLPVTDVSMPTAGGVLTSQATVRPTQKSTMVDVPFTHKVMNNSALQTQEVSAALHNIRATQKIGVVDMPLPVADPSLSQVGGVLTSQATVRATQKTGLVDATLPIGDPSMERAGGILTSQATVRPTQKFDQEVFPVAAIAPVAKAGVIVSEHNIKDTLKTPGVEIPFRVGDPSFAIAGGVLTSQADVRDTLKGGVVDSAFRINDPNAPDIGGVLTSQATVRPTLRIHTEDSFPTGAVRVVGDPGYLQLDKTLPCTERMTMPVFSHQPGPNGQTFGDLLPLQNLTTKQVRGTKVQQYITQNSQVTSGVGGTSNRVIGAFQQLKPKSDTFVYGPPGPGFYQPNTGKIIPSMRLTQRAINDMEDLLSVDNDC